jgi:uncharacterized protein
LCKRIRGRALHKTYELFGDLATEAGKDEALSVAKSIAKGHGLDVDLAVGCDVASVDPLDVTDAPLSVVFQKGAPRPLEEVSFVLGRLAGQTVSRTRLVLVPEIRQEVVAALHAKNG